MLANRGGLKVRIRNKIKYAALGFALLGAAALGATSVYAADDSVNANVTIAEAVSVAGLDTMEFGTIAASTNGSSNDFAVGCDDAATGPTLIGNGAWLNKGGVRAATFSVTGVDGESVDYTVTIASLFTDGDVVLTLTGTHPTNAAACTDTLSASTTADATVSVAGKINVASGTSNGAKTGASINLVANYQ